MKLVSALVLILAVAAGSPALAAPLPYCAGYYAIIRTSTVKPGKLDDFRRAVHDNQAWYIAHGLKDTILFGLVADRDANGEPTGTYAPNMVMTVHTNRAPTQPVHAPDDAQWSAFVAEYEASSDLVSASAVCMTAP